MYPVLILRTEFICLILLIFMEFTCWLYHINSDNKTFKRILAFAITHVIFDMVTVYTVNNTDSIPNSVNNICHILFYLSAILYSNEMLNYVVSLCYPKLKKCFYIVGHAMTTLYICLLPLMEIKYVEAEGTMSSSGSAAIVGYGTAFIFFIMAVVMIFVNMKIMPTSIKSALIPMMLVLMTTEVIQIIRKDILFTGGAITIVTIGLFFSLENPIIVLKNKAMTDALTGVRSRNCFDEDMVKLEAKFAEKPNDDYIFVFCDLDSLRSVNNRFGHAEGDHYITLIATFIRKCMAHCNAVYRIGGDEFLVLYHRVSETIVNEEINDIKKACELESKKHDYVVSVSAGYACSSQKYHKLQDVVKTADYAMYQDKANKKIEKDSFGTKINYSGLTDKTFDAICASNNSNYPYITNLDTNVTRISPAWKEYFGLDSEFYDDFLSVWRERIHPDYLDGYLEDVVSVMNGHKKYHNYVYLAKKVDGEYVKITCNGSMYKDVSTGTSYFVGFISNHAMRDNVDALTGLPSFSVIDVVVTNYMNQSKPFAIMKLKLNNFSHVNMLYGYEEGNKVIKTIADILNEELKENGKLYCQGSVNFSIVFDIVNEKEINRFYKKISSRLSEGVEVNKAKVPIIISGGLVVNNGEKKNIENIRGNLVYALEESRDFQRNELVVFHGDNLEKQNVDISLLTNIHADALSRMQYYKLRYQPIVDVATQKTIGAEALLRWVHPIYGEVPPSKFISFIENDPCYYRLGLHIIETAVEDAIILREKIPDFKMNVNITAVQLRNNDFIDDVIKLLDKYNYPHNGIVLELTERCKEMDTQFLSERIATLRKKGVLVAFDDLGTGYSTVSILMNIPVDEVKLDKDFVRDLATNPSYQLFVKALVAGTSLQGFKYNICFEGIETKETLDLVASFGNFFVQGYYFSKPLFIEDLQKYINS